MGLGLASSQARKLASSRANRVVESPRDLHPSDVRLSDGGDAPRSARAVLPSNRNGYASVARELVVLVARVPLVPGRSSRTVILPRGHEERLRDGDVTQLGAIGLRIASKATQAEWREFLRRHFRLQHDLQVVFEGTKLGVE